MTDANGARFNGFQGSMLRDTVDLANVSSCEFAFSNGLETIDTLRADGRIEGVDPGMCRLDVTMTTRWADNVLLDQAIARQFCSLELSHTNGADIFFVRAERLFLERPDKAVSGPGGIQATFRGSGSIDTTPPRMVTVRLTNSVASYA